ncbi:MAG: GNAT family N-acetyltransferase [Planctomycetota bacterium]|jgi:ribosomal protein S18 acetylase RimI-like enzyme
MVFEIQRIEPNVDKLDKVMELHFQVLPSRAYESAEKKANLPHEIVASLTGRQGVILAAMEDNQCVGYKVAYVTGNRKEKLYVWLGGVHPVYRRKGVATALMDAMITYAKEVGVEYMESHVYGTNQAMMILNLQSGFDIGGCMHGAGTNTVRVIMRKPIP